MSEWKTFEEILPEIGQLMAEEPEHGYEKVERRWEREKGALQESTNWSDLFLWGQRAEYRIKSEEIEYTVRRPEPLRTMPKPGKGYWTASPGHENWAFYFSWFDIEMIRRDFQRGLCYATEEEAVAAAKAMANWKGE